MLLKRRMRKKADALTDISLTPLIDTALTLLVIFMIAAPAAQHAIKVNLPRSRTASKQEAQQEITVYVDHDNQLFFNDVRVSPDDLIKELNTVLVHDADRTVFLRADQRVSYGKIVDIVDHLKLVGGVKYVALAMHKQSA